MHNKKLFRMTQGALIAALYVALSLISNAVGLASGPVQVRLSEVLTVLPFFTPAAVPGLCIGCLLSNLLTGCALWDVLFGTLATLLGAVGARLLRRHRYLVSLPTLLSNTLIIPFILQFAYGATQSLPFLIISVGAGEFLSACVLGTLLLLSMRRYHFFNTL